MWLKVRSVCRSQLVMRLEPQTMSEITLEELSMCTKDVDGIVKKHLCERGGKFQVVDCTIRRLSDTPKGLLASHFIMTVDLKEKKVRYADMSESSDSDSSEEKSCTFFVKFLPQTEFGVKYSEESKFFRKESRIYGQIIPRLQDVGIGHTPWTAHCYHIDENSLLVLENLNEREYIPTTSYELDLHHLKIALMALARMHGASIALEMRTRTEIPELYPGILEENSYPETNGIRRKAFKVMSETVIELSRIVSGYDDWDHNEIIEAFPEVLHRIYDLVKPSETHQNVINHSDIWANNILFKYDAEIQHVEGTDVSAVKRIPVDARLIDFQFCRYAPPAFDIASFLYVSCNREFREKHQPQLLDTYYNALEEDLSTYGFVVQDIIPRTSFDQSYEYYKLAGLIQNLVFDSVIFLPGEFWSDITNCSEKFEEFYTSTHTRICLEMFENCPRYRKKMEDLLIEIIEGYVLKSEYNQRL